MNGLVCVIVTLISMVVVVVLAAPWIGFVLDKYLDWCIKVQAKWKR